MLVQLYEIIPLSATLLIQVFPCQDFTCVALAFQNIDRIMQTLSVRTAHASTLV